MFKKLAESWCPHDASLGHALIFWCLRRKNKIKKQKSKKEAPKTIWGRQEVFYSVPLPWGPKKVQLVS